VIPRDRWQWFGSAGHFCAGHYCRFHLTTQVGKYLISTVGDYHPAGLSNTSPAQTIGIDRTYETMVFAAGPNCECGCGLPEAAGGNLDFAGYTNPKDATLGHLELCRKWARKQ